MKKIALIIYVLLTSILCFGQDTELDKTFLNSRNSADSILRHFSEIKGPKMLYSINDIYYYVIIKSGIDDFQEYYVKKDSSNVLINKVSNVFLEKKVKRKTKKYYSDVKNEIIKTFTLGSSLDFTSSISNARFNFCDSKTIYYVLKDENGNNHDEIKLSLEDSLKIFNPILSTYFIKQLASFMYK